MSLLRNRRAGLLGAGPLAIQAAAQREAANLIRPRAPSLIASSGRVIREENPLNSLGEGMALFGQTLAAQKQKKIETELARQKAEREGLLANSLIDSRKSQAAAAKRRNELKALELRQANLLAQLREAGLDKRQEAKLKASLRETQLEIDGRLKAAQIPVARELTREQKIEGGYNVTDNVVVYADGRVKIAKDGKAPTSDNLPTLPDIPIPTDIENPAEAARGSGFVGEKFRRLLLGIEGDAKRDAPTTKLLSTIRKTNNEVVEFGQSFRDGPQDRTTNMARRLTLDTLPTEKVIGTPQDYIASVQGTALRLRGIVQSMQAAADDPDSSFTAKQRARSNLPAARRLSNFYTRLEAIVTGADAGTSDLIKKADALVKGL